MDGTARPTEAPLEVPATASVPAAEVPRRRWSWPKMHHLLFLAFTLVAGVPIAVLAIWEGRDRLPE